jgi:UDP-N-acetylglucosamine--N-acetylmuramyl-(pentapeptide) pyrophosphoryl-undecaprenol N-acetylglucosamine transferase
MKIVLVGGHFSPAFALLQAVSKTDEVLFLGRKYAIEGESAHSFEYVICQKEKIPFFDIPAGRFQRKLTKFSLISLFKTSKGVNVAKKILQQERPDLVVSFGGYLSIPVALAAKMLSIPVVIHEQTQRGGLANRFIGKFIADKICVTFESSRKYFPRSKTVLTGLPLRREVFEEGEPIISVPKEEKLLYVTGGSTGSHFINELIGQNLISLLSAFTIIHQTGDSSEYKDFEKLQELQNGLSDDLKKKYCLKKFIEPREIGWILQNTDAVISRSGINTVVELLELGIPALLIPLPLGQRNEQLENAELFVSKGLGEYLLQKDGTSENFLSALGRVLQISRVRGKTKEENPVRNLLAIIKEYEKKELQKKISTD